MLFVVFILFSQNSFALDKLSLSDIKIKSLYPTKEMKIINLEIVKILEKHHKKLAINDSLSPKIFTNYIETLDPFKNIFLNSEIKELKNAETFFDDAIKLGYLTFAFSIFNEYQRRYVDRLIFSIKRLENNWNDFDFKKNETIETNREKLKWPITNKERNNRWRKKLKLDILSLKFSKKKDAEIKKTLIKRYRSRLGHFLQTRDIDVFQSYINSFTHLYDAHTDYFSPRVSEDFDIHMKLSFEGIGATLSPDNDYTKVVSLIPGGPAEKAGELRSEDYIIGVGQDAKGEIIDVVGWRLDKVVGLIRGKKGSTVRLKIISNNSIEKKNKIIKIVRDKITLKDQEAGKKIVTIEKNSKKYKIGIIDIPVFYLDFAAFVTSKPDYKSVSKDVKVIVEEITKEGVDGIIIDIRHNGGGALHETPVIAGLFIKTGPVVQVYERENNKYTSFRDNDPNVFFDGPLIVLVDRNSASASEIFAGAIQDYKRGIIIGSNTFGKGSVQAMVPLSKGQIKYTNSKYYRISGESTQHKGVIPDIIFPSLYNEKKIGESSYKTSLPWDKISKMVYSPYGKVNDKIIQTLTKKHKKRIQNDIDFITMQKSIDLISEISKKTQIPLNEKTRKKELDKIEKKQIDIINKQRIANNKPTVKNIEGLEKETSKNTDAFLKESEMIMCDYIELLKIGAF